MLTLIQNPVLMQSIVSDSVVCQSVCHTSEPCKKLLYHPQSSMSCIQQVYQSSLLFSQNVHWCSMLPPGESRLVCATHPIIKVGTKDWTDRHKDKFWTLAYVDVDASSLVYRLPERSHHRGMQMLHCCHCRCSTGEGVPSEYLSCYHLTVAHIQI